MQTLTYFGDFKI